MKIVWRLFGALGLFGLWVIGGEEREECMLPGEANKNPKTVAKH